MLNKSLQNLTGTPCNASAGNMTRKVYAPGPGSFGGMGKFAVRKGENTRGSYIVKGCGDKRY